MLELPTLLINLFFTWKQKLINEQKGKKRNQGPYKENNPHRPNILTDK